MSRKLPFKYRKWVFAAAMSCSTSLIVSGVILALRGVRGEVFLSVWLQAFLTAWPIVLVAILLLAPRIDRWLDIVVERGPAG